MEFLSLSKFKLQLQALIGETRDLRENESQARKDLRISIQKQKQSDADFSKMLQALREELALCNESRKQLEIEVKCLQQENTMLEMKQRELRETINSLLQSREIFINSHEDSTCELKRSVEERDKRLILLSQELQAHLKLFDSIQEEAFSVKQIVEKVECLVSEKEQLSKFSVAELKTKMDEISTYEKESIEKMSCLEKKLGVNQDELQQKNALISELKEQLEDETLKDNMQLQMQESTLSVKEEIIQSLTVEKQVLNLEVQSLEFTLRKIQDHVINICTKDQEQLSNALEVQKQCQMVSRELNEALKERIHVGPKDPADHNVSGEKDHQSTVDTALNLWTHKRKGSGCSPSVHQLDCESSTT